jgi:Uri superfamily endonuclease
MNEKRHDRDSLDLPSQPGTYALLLEATTTQDVPVGKLGVLRMLPGIYVYVGSALGPGGLAARIERHALREKVLHWHIDYLRAETRLVAVWFARGANQGECRWSRMLERADGALIPLDGLGSSDCRCRSHLQYFADLSAADAVRSKLKCRAIRFTED